VYFVTACGDARADLLYHASLALNECYGAWLVAMKKVAVMKRVQPRVRRAFVPIWVEHKTLPLTIGDRRVTAAALRVLMPRGYRGKALTVYRGASANEHKTREYGFSWTTDIAIARRFAENWARPEVNSESVLLRTTVPAKAVLLARKPEDYYDEGEVVVDPYQLGEVETI
jgi:hypothetical protein